MRLTRVEIFGFKSIKKQCSLIIDNRITILIGANDHGKSNLLSALMALNDDAVSTFKAEDKHWDLDENTPIKIEWHFTFTNAELEDLKNEFLYKKPEVAPVVESIKEGAMPPNLEVKAEQINPDLFQISQTNELVFFREGINQPLKIFETPFEIEKSKEASLLVRKPRVERFEPADLKFLDTVAKENLEETNYSAMKGIFIIANIWEKREQIFTQSPVTEKLLADASKKLTQALRNQWAQGEKHIWHLRHDNGKITLLIEDNVIKNTYIKPSQRSSGFKTYFYLCMSIISKNYNMPKDNQFIYLFDEPGTYLHPKAQIDLQRSFELIADNSQIVYTTHSLFLISKNYPKRNRVVLKTLDGTLIDHKPFAENWKSVRNSLGILMSNNLLIADKSLLVEGRSDVLYLLNALRQMKEKKQIDIDVNDFTIMDAGDSSNYSAMAKLMMNDGRSIFCLVDNDDGGNKIKARVEKVCKSTEEKNIVAKVFQLPHINLSENTSTEDLFVDVKILRKAIKKVIENLIGTEERQLKSEYITDNILNTSFLKELSKIKPLKKQTLGTTIKNLSKTWFTDGDELSKVSIAAQYVTLCEIPEYKPEDQSSIAVEVMTKIKTNMLLRGEKDIDKGVMEEVTS